MSSIHAIIFDLGAVLVELDFKPLFRDLGVPPETSIFQSVETMNRWAFYDAFERGKIGESAFVAALGKQVGKDIEVESFRPLWNSIIQRPVEGVPELIEMLAKKLPLYVLTNSTAPHMDYVAERFPWLKHFKKVFTSFELGCRKPEREIYSRVAEEIGLPPPELLFIDDREDNVEGAREVGYHAELCKRSPQDIFAILKKHRLNFLG